MLEVESRFSVEEKVACSCWEGRLEALQLGFTPTSRSGNTRDTKNNELGNRKSLEVLETKCDCAIRGNKSCEIQLGCELIRQDIKVKG